MIEFFEKNTQGRDFVMGDIHAHKKRFLRALESVDFDTSKDRLFCLGDLIDRGKQPLYILTKLYEEDWFFSIRGNHEQMIIDRFENPIAKPPYMTTIKTQDEASELHRYNGGKWFDKLRNDLAREHIYQLVSKLPFAMEIECDAGLVGLVHAEVPEDFESWDSFIDELNNSAKVQDEVLWNRLAIESVFNAEAQRFWHEWSSEFEDEPRFIKGIDAVIHGHTPVREVIQCGNQFWIDTAFKTNDLTILEINQLVEMVNSCDETK